MRRLAVILSFLITFGLASSAFANTAETIPEGIFVIGLKYGYSFANDQFGREWGTKTRSIVDDYNITITGADLDPYVYSTEDKIGKLDVDYDAYGQEFQLTMAYGITDSLAFMLIMPVRQAYQSIDFNLLDSNMYMVRNAANEPAMVATQKTKDMNWEAMGMTRADHVLNADEFKEIISCRSSTALCQFRYKPIETYNRWGLGEIILGSRYRFYQSEKWRQAITLFLKLPTGRHTDTDDIRDRNYGDQQVDLGFWYNIDFSPIDQLRFNVSFGYTEQMPDIKEKRIYSRSWDADGYEQGIIPVGTWESKEYVHRDIGGNWDLYFGFDWKIFKYLTYGNEFYFFWKYQDNYYLDHKVNSEGILPDVRSLEFGTNQSCLEMSNFISFSTVDWVVKGEFPLPFNIGMGYTTGLAGMNFERTHKFWVSLDLIGSIYMLESGGGDTQEDAGGTEDFQLPGRTSKNSSGWVSPVAHRKASKKKFTEEDAMRTSVDLFPTRNINW